MPTDYYKTAFEAAVKELATLSKAFDDLSQQQELLEDRMEKVRLGAVSLATLANLDFQKIQEDYPEMFDSQRDPRIGITEAVRSVLRDSKDMLTPIKIRDEVYDINPTIAGHKNPLASIHAVLRRLVDANQIIIGTDEDGKTSYGWVDCDDFEERLNRWVSNPEEMIKRIKARKKKKA